MSELIPRRSAAEVRELRASEGGLRLLDVRTRDARELHPQEIAGIGLGAAGRRGRVRAGVPRDTPIVTYCT